ncbi:nitrogenase component 1 [Sphaerotilus microaerophilus]|uniref:Nitrogenase/oxidoreductase component 1 domain-containing protein n=1 Tax=Sphaerotilus microaerophilus TaxID=2914710 RepID=A0ABN6PMN1_9BURK|nr:nitrogenase component 1 [Sphaerotilus sp. FB-5]BDI06444.1 hypothetical protein CATMQ487_34140 [Sphaerotilus sp. FB-5]
MGPLAAGAGCKGRELGGDWPPAVLAPVVPRSLGQPLTPGAAAGGCAFDGATIALQPIVDAAHLVHGPIACEGNRWDNRHSASSGSQGYRTGFTTDLNELDVIHGGEKRLFQAIREIARLRVARGADAELQDRTEALSTIEEARAWERIRAYRQRLTGKKMLLITGGVKSRSVVSALQEAGLEVVGSSVKKSTQDDKERLKEMFATIHGDQADAHMIDAMTPRQMYAILREARADIMLSDGHSEFVALKARMPWMDINLERHHAFAGCEGMVTMVEQIDKALFNPMWAQVRLPAPWEVSGPLLREQDTASLAAEAAPA